MPKIAFRVFIQLFTCEVSVVFLSMWYWNWLWFIRNNRFYANRRSEILKYISKIACQFDDKFRIKTLTVMNCVHKVCAVCQHFASGKQFFKFQSQPVEFYSVKLNVRSFERLSADAVNLGRQTATDFCLAFAFEISVIYLREKQSSFRWSSNNILRSFSYFENRIWNWNNFALKSNMELVQLNSSLL